MRRLGYDLKTVGGLEEFNENGKTQPRNKRNVYRGNG